MDRGYNKASVTRLLLKLRCQLLGTHSEKVGKWPYCTSGLPREWQQPIPVDGATELLQPADFAAISLNRDWYLLLLDYLNSRIEDPADKATPQEVLEIQSVWMLQCFYSTTATKLPHLRISRNGTHHFEA
jgi:hypothetical protein